MKTLIICLLSILLVAPCAYADRLCYGPNELKSEQWLRLHSELMVITVSCHHNSQGESLVPLYQEFTRTNIKVLHNAEADLIDFYDTFYQNNGLEHLDRLRTLLANEFAQKVADMSVPRFCEKFHDKLNIFYQQTDEQLDNEVERMVKKERSNLPLCPGGHNPLLNK